MTDKQRYTLSRRTVLGGVGAVGLVATGAGLGTSAYFNDTEAFRDNRLRAGRLNLGLDWRGQYNDRDVLGLDLDDTVADGVGIYRRAEGLADGAASLLVVLDDLAPGDKALVEIGFVLDDNPAHLWMRTRPGPSRENGYTEPEERTNTSAGGALDPAFTGRGLDGDFVDSGDAAGVGELADELEVHVSHSDGQYSREYDTNGGPALDVDVSGLGYLNGRGDLASGSARHVFGTALADGVKLYRDPLGPSEVFEPAPTAPNPNNASVTFEFDLPTTVTNNVQTDSIAFEIDVTTGQARHDGTNANPFAP